MLISRKILQSYFDKPLPDSLTIARELTLKSYEVESIESVEEDEVFDIDVLPNRASDSLSHMGVAREVGLALGLASNLSSDAVELEEIEADKIEISVEDDSATRFAAASISLGSTEGVRTPGYIKEALVALGERTINPIVDITNYVMLTIGQPLHAYDLDIVESISGKAALTSGFSKAGEKLTLLDGAEVVLTGEELVIRSGAERALGLAGVKGGLESGVSEKTSRVLLEAAIFDPKLARRTSKLTKTQTGGSKRFENGVPTELVGVGMNKALDLLREVYPGLKVEAIRDYRTAEESTNEIILKKDHPKRLLGVEVESEEIRKILDDMGARVDDMGDSFSVAPPWYRPDLKVPVDIVEEVGRLYGLTKITSKELPAKAVTPERSTVAKEVVRDLLVVSGYSEVITRAFRKKGEVELVNPLATDVPFLRSEMIESTKTALDLASHNAELLDLGHVRIFEIGTVFKEDSEELHLTVGIQKTKNARTKINLQNEILNLESRLKEKLGLDINGFRVEEEAVSSGLVVEYDLGRIVESVDLMPQWENPKQTFNTYQEFSVFPYILRDIAVWTPKGTTAEDVESVIREKTSDLLRGVSVFDRFEKDTGEVVRISYAFRLVFQSFEKTLSDGEVNAEMELVYSALSQMPGFEIR